jgi:hypothetical protein
MKEKHLFLDFQVLGGGEQFHLVWRSLLTWKRAGLTSPVEAAIGARLRRLQNRLQRMLGMAGLWVGEKMLRTELAARKLMMSLRVRLKMLLAHATMHTACL